MTHTAQGAQRPPNTASPPPPSTNKVSQYQLVELARFYEFGLTPVDQQMSSALRELAALRTSHEQLRALLIECLADYSAPKFADCHYMARRIRAALKQAVV